MNGKKARSIRKSAKQMFNSSSPSVTKDEMEHQVKMVNYKRPDWKEGDPAVQIPHITSRWHPMSKRGMYQRTKAWYKSLSAPERQGVLFTHEEIFA